MALDLASAGTTHLHTKSVARNLSAAIDRTRRLKKLGVAGGLATRSVNIPHEYASLPRGSTCKTPPPHEDTGVRPCAGMRRLIRRLAHPAASTEIRRHRALTASRPCANVTLLLRRVAHLIILRAVDLAWCLRNFATNRHE
jgi:hypothetical protein